MTDCEYCGEPDVDVDDEGRCLSCAIDDDAERAEYESNQDWE